MRAASLIAFALALLTACVTAPAPKAAPGAIPETAVDFPDTRTLRVVYRLSAPAAALAFKRSPDDSRTRDWRPTDPAFHVIVDPDAETEIIRRRDGAGFTSVALVMDARYSAPPKDYAPFMPFHRDGLLFHTGRLQACVIRCAEGRTAFPMIVTPPPGARVSAGRSFVDRGDGRMIYVGAAAPIDTAYAVAMIDPALPDAFRARLDALLPRLLAEFGRELGAPRARPELYATLDPSARPDGDPQSNTFSSHGGVLPGQIFMHLRGDGWLEDPSRWGRFGDGAAWFFAHEAAHLFQRLDGVDPRDGDTWIHEGGAEALAAVAGLRLGIVSPAYVESRVREAATVCANALQAGPLGEASARGAFESHYACGMLLQLAAHEEVRGRGHDVYSIWRSFLGRTRRGAPWAADVFLETLREVGAPDAAALADRMLAPDPRLSAETLIQAARPRP